MSTQKRTFRFCRGRCAFFTCILLISAPSSSTGRMCGFVRPQASVVGTIVGTDDEVTDTLIEDLLRIMVNSAGKCDPVKTEFTLRQNRVHTSPNNVQLGYKLSSTGKMILIRSATSHSRIRLACHFSGFSHF